MGNLTPYDLHQADATAGYDLHDLTNESTNVIIFVNIDLNESVNLRILTSIMKGGFIILIKVFCLEPAFYSYMN